MCIRDSGWYYILDGTRTRGFEVELAGEVTPGWNVFLGYTYRQSKDNEGKKVQTTQPEQLLKLSTAYRLPGAWNKLTVGGGVDVYKRQGEGLAHGEAADLPLHPVVQEGLVQPELRHVPGLAAAVDLLDQHVVADAGVRAQVAAVAVGDGHLERAAMPAEQLVQDVYKRQGSGGRAARG